MSPSQGLDEGSIPSDRTNLECLTGVPVIQIDNELIVGFDKPVIAKLLGIS